MLAVAVQVPELEPSAGDVTASSAHVTAVTYLRFTTTPSSRLEERSETRRSMLRPPYRRLTSL
jgi:hypothetical protein